MANEDAKEATAKAIPPDESGSEEPSLGPELMHFGMEVSYGAAWSPNLETGKIIPMFRAAVYDIEGRKIGETFVLLDDLIEAVAKGVDAVTSAFQIANQMKGFKLVMGFQTRESLVKHFDDMI